MDFVFDASGLNKATREMMDLPGLFHRAMMSALRSTGWMIRGGLRNYVETSGEGGWPATHPVTRFYARKYNTGKVGAIGWLIRKKNHEGPMAWLGKHARYRVTDTEAIIGFGKSHGAKEGKARRAMPGTIDKFLTGVVGRAEEGETTQVTKKMRRFFGATRENPSGFFPLRRDTQTLKTPRRPIFDPVMSRIKGNIAPHFEDKFWYAVSRYREGVREKI